MGSGYGACEDRGCGNVGSVQEVSTHTLICYIDHPSTVHSIEVSDSRIFSSLCPGSMAGLFNTTDKHQYLLCNHKFMLCTTECIKIFRIDHSSNFSFTTWDVHTKSTCVHCTLVASDKYILVPLFVYMYM